MYQEFGKRFLDIFVATFAFIVLSPVFLGVTILLSLVNQGSPFFLQRRPGKQGKSFAILKFKTMNDRRDEKGELLPDAQRLTKIGQWVRQLSLDEIPQLINVIKGDMSLIGPRPLLEEYLPLYSAEQARRHDVRPGITGWAQVNGRNAISWEEKFALDVWYVDHYCFSLDLEILWRTIKKVWIREGISAQGEATMSKFTGQKRVIGIYGASGFGKEVYPLVRSQYPHPSTQFVFIDDNKAGSVLNGVTVCAYESFKALDGDKEVVLAIANSQVREKLAAQLQADGISQASIKADNALVYDEVTLGEGAILCGFVHLTSSIRIGRSFHANIYSYVAHDCVIGDYVTFAPAVKCNGNVHIHDHAYIGTGAVIKQGTPDKPLVIGQGAIIGMGAVVTKDVPAGAVVVGNPAKPLNKSS